MNFEWHDEKERENLRKHRVSFQEARHVFADMNRISYIDTRLDYGEERIVTIGLIAKGVYVVVYTETNDTVRIISARRATKQEIKHYDNHQNYI
jgi:hypothetical protein